MRGIGINLAGKDISVKDRIKLIKQIGFDTVFFDYLGDETANMVDISRKNGLSVDSLHAPFDKINSFWKSGEETENCYSLMIRIIDCCSENEVSKLVMHTTVGNNPPSVNKDGLLRYQNMCDYAKDMGVRICFENLEPFPHFHSVMEYIKDYHGFCWDCGHNLCYTPHVDMMKLYDDRLMCLHLHDNKGVTQPGNIDYRDDLHMLPFDGVLDWIWVAEKIAKSKYSGPLTFEYSNRTVESNSHLTYEQFLQTAYERAVTFRKMVEKAETQI